MTFDLIGTVREVVREEIRAALRESNGQAFAGDILTYAQAGKLIQVDKSLIGRWVHDGLLAAHGRGKARRVYRADVLKALELSSRPKAEPTAQDIAANILSKSVRRIR